MDQVSFFKVSLGGSLEVMGLVDVPLKVTLRLGNKNLEKVIEGKDGCFTVSVPWVFSVCVDFS